jgi:hypothetical protein
MLFSHLHAPRATRRAIDITPGAGWRRAGKWVLAAAVATILVPLFCLLGALLLLGMLCAAIVLGTAMAIHPGGLRGIRRFAERRSKDDL